ncbi:U32 family peptidase [Gehongia tenuis]|uniref:U32 family peptidase n=1 Tax=Gehongia tenuis TaxID=2763655 RepID=A0A926D4P5_9FIRM|nr:U32 family peptidase [Gehongia tenuis]MBC8531412.1 U32 family peptidase [Gehongia tenuis]
MRLPELLAPAGSWDAMTAAVQSGADAVYLGAQGFNARASASNFDEEGLPRAVDYCHARGTKVLVTVNTLILPQEMEQAMALVEQLWRAGADGLIVQDVGLAAEIRTRYPDAPLHGSTQMSVHNLEGAAQLEEWGFKRVVLGREVSLQDIRKIVQSTAMEVEVFVHGAMCVSLSGACLMSSMIGGRSGNRGRCAQPCRLPYTWLEEGEREMGRGYLLSPKDQCTVPFLADIVSCGVKSLKVEGRMKRPEYVAVVIETYRRALDAIGELGHYEATPEDLLALKKIFHRGGFSEGYFFGVRDRELMGQDRPNHGGIRVGRVVKVNGRQAFVEPEPGVHLVVGDGVEFRGHGGDCGMEIQRLASSKGLIQLEAPGGVLAGDEVYRTTDAAQLRAVGEKLAEDRRRVPVSMELTLLPGRLPRMTLTAGDITLAVEGTEEVQRAAKRPLQEEDVLRQMRMGDSFLKPAFCHVELDDSFMPVSQLNDLRRRAVAAMEREWLHQKLPRWSFFEPLKGDQDKPEAAKSVRPELWLQGDKEILERLLDQPLAGVYWTPRDWTADLRSEGERLREKAGKKKIYVSVPTLLLESDYEAVFRKLETLRGTADGILAPNLGAVHGSLRTGWKVVGDSWLNVTHGGSLRELLKLGLERVTLSNELTLAQLEAAGRGWEDRCEAVVHGHIPVMNLAHCPAKALSPKSCHNCGRPLRFLRDRRGYAFPWVSTRITRCQTTLYNSVPLALAARGRLPQVSALRLIALGESSDTVRGWVEDYLRLLAGKPVQHSYVGSTLGHAYRGVE